MFLVTKTKARENKCKTTFDKKEVCRQWPKEPKEPKEPKFSIVQCHSEITEEEKKMYKICTFSQSRVAN